MQTPVRHFVEHYTFNTLIYNLVYSMVQWLNWVDARDYWSKSRLHHALAINLVKLFKRLCLTYKMEMTSIQLIRLFQVNTKKAQACSNWSVNVRYHCYQYRY